jgi:hypothetical protein
VGIIIKKLFRHIQPIQVNYGFISFINDMLSKLRGSSLLRSLVVGSLHALQVVISADIFEISV